MNKLIKKAAIYSALLLSTIVARTSFADLEGTSRTFPKVHESETVAEAKPSLGINIGLADTDNSRSTLGYGIEFGFQPIIPFSSAFSLSGYSSEHKADIPTLTRTMLMYKASYNFGGTIPVIKNSFAGLKVGPVFDNINRKLDVELGVAPTVGFDFLLGGDLSHYSLGANADYMFVGGSKNDVFALNGVAKYWF